MARAEHSQEATSQAENAQKGRPPPVSEEHFFSIARLNPASDHDRRLYLLMKTEAMYAVQNSSHPPVDETRIRQAMNLLYQSASPDTKRLYDVYEDPAVVSPGNNWIIRWLIWQALAQI